MVRFLGSFSKRSDGSATVEFALLFPLFVAIFLMGFESGLYMYRNVMLERGVDLAIRDVRLGNGKIPELAEFKTSICDNAFFDDEDGECSKSLMVEMRQIEMEPGGASNMMGDARCVDRRHEEDQSDFGSYDVGGTNEVVMVRVCYVQSPIFPTTGIGLGMGQANDLGGNYALISTSAFVTEPGTRTFVTGTSGTITCTEDCEEDGSEPSADGDAG